MLSRPTLETSRTAANLLLIAAVAFVAGIAPLHAAEPLDLDQLDSITAGKVTATALAQAAALGPRARTFASTDVSVRRSRIASVVLQRVNGRVVVARKGEERDIEVGFARAEGAPQAWLQRWRAPPTSASRLDPTFGWLNRRGMFSRMPLAVSARRSASLSRGTRSTGSRPFGYYQ